MHRVLGKLYLISTRCIHYATIYKKLSDLACELRFFPWFYQRPSFHFFLCDCD